MHNIAELEDSDPFGEDEDELQEYELILEYCIVFIVAFSCSCHQIRVTRFVHIVAGYYSRVASISFSTSGGVATIRKRRLIESDIGCSKYVCSGVIF
jgi:hypothetical protein